MPGMNADLSPASPILTSAFRSALWQQFAIVALIFALLLIAWGMTRTATFGIAIRKSAGMAAGAWREPGARRLLRIGFGVIWLFDGLLQAQPQMAGGLADQVIAPSAAASPGWVQHLVNFGVTAWDYHPIQAAAAAVWIQVGIGLWLILAVRGRSARFAGLASVAWGLVVWAFGESFGGIFAPGLTVLFGAPGAALLYVVAGALVALPERAWDGRRPGRLLLGGTGAFFLGMALLQAWPGRGFWQGTADGKPTSLAAMIQSMAGTSQPHPIEALVSGFGNFTAGHGFAVNLVAVIALAVIGAGLVAAAVRASARLAAVAVIAGAVFCLADWLLVEDLGFFGGLGTDPNSMVPFVLLLTAGYLGLAPVPQLVTAAAGQAGEQSTERAVLLAAPTPDACGSSADDAAATDPAATDVTPADGEPAASLEPPADEPDPGPAPAGPQQPPGRIPALVRAVAGTPLRVIAGVGALGVILAGAAPMAFASVSRTADPITAQAIAGTTGQFDTPAANFTLTSQNGQQVALSSLRGKVVLLTFLDPVCITDCPLIAQEMKSADALLGSKAGDTELVAVVANPTYRSTAYTKAFTDQENLSQVSNWLYLTGSLNQLENVWHDYGIEVEDLPAGAMAAHNDLAFVIDAHGNIRQEISDDPGPGTSATKASFASLLADSVTQTMSTP
jgi:cytochrome oxidase Cu insertion factor (SCO1/SenC/PrrC family)